ncbi:hypothetical protein Tco_0015674 [Tanacetum coccineum]
MQCYEYCLVLSTSFRGFLHLVSSMLLVLAVCMSTLGPEFVLVSAPLEYLLSLSQLVFVSAPLSLDLVSALGHLESTLGHLESALGYLAIQTI